MLVGAAKLIVIANNCPPLRKSEIEYYAMLAQTGVHHYHGSKPSPLPYCIILGDFNPCVSLVTADNVDLGTACGKLYTVSTLSITDPGDSDILKVHSAS